MERQILQCIEDMLDIVAEGKYNLDAQARAYDLLEGLIELYDGVPISQSLNEAADCFRSAYEENAAILSLSFDSAALKEEAAERLMPAMRPDLRQQRQHPFMSLSKKSTTFGRIPESLPAAGLLRNFVKGRDSDSNHTG